MLVQNMWRPSESCRSAGSGAGEMRDRGHQFFERFDGTSEFESE